MMTHKRLEQKGSLASVIKSHYSCSLDLGSDKKAAKRPLTRSGTKSVNSKYFQAAVSRYDSLDTWKFKFSLSIFMINFCVIG